MRGAVAWVIGGPSIFVLALCVVDRIIPDRFVDWFFGDAE